VGSASSCSSFTPTPTNSTSSLASLSISKSIATNHSYVDQETNPNSDQQKPLVRSISIDHRIIITDKGTSSNHCNCAQCSAIAIANKAQLGSSGSSVVLNNESCWCRCADCCCIENCCVEDNSTTNTTGTTTETEEELMLNGSSATSSTNSTGYCGAGGSMGQNSQLQTIEDQIKHVDRIIKDCDVSRKNLEHINRRLDDLNDEVRRYREFLGHEKSRRDPALYKTSNVEQPSPYNEGICGIIATLTSQLALEWNEKLRCIQSQPLSSRLHDKN